MKISKTALVALSICILAAGCSAGKKEITDKVRVFTSILPQKYFVEKIGSDFVQVEVLVGPGKNPATYELTPQQMTALGSADILFTIGVPFEQALLPSIKSTLKNLLIADTSEGIIKRKLIAHSHDDEHDEHEGADDPHIWLSPVLVKKQAGHMYNALVETDPKNKEHYKAGYDILVQELNEVDAELKKALAPFKGNTMFVFHPAFGYLADLYGLKQVAIETGGKEPAPSVLEEIIEHALEEEVKIIFVQPEFSKAAANAVAGAIDGAVVMLNPLDPEYISNLKHIASEIEKAFR